MVRGSAETTRELALLLREGMGAWMAAWQQISPAAPTPNAAGSCHNGTLLSNEKYSEIVNVLTAMALSGLKEVIA